MSDLRKYIDLVEASRHEELMEFAPLIAAGVMALMAGLEMYGISDSGSDVIDELVKQKADSVSNFKPAPMSGDTFNAIYDNGREASVWDTLAQMGEKAYNFGKQGLEAVANCFGTDVNSVVVAAVITAAIGGAAAIYSAMSKSSDKEYMDKIQSLNPQQITALVTMVLKKRGISQPQVAAAQIVSGLAKHVQPQYLATTALAAADNLAKK